MNAHTSSGATPFPQVSNVSLQYRTAKHLVTATYRFSFDVYRDDRYVSLGPSVCGKSTLLNAVGGCMAPTEGSMRLRSAQIVGAGADRIFIFQEFDQLLPWKTVKQNVMFALESSGRMLAKPLRRRPCAPSRKSISPNLPMLIRTHCRAA